MIRSVKIEIVCLLYLVMSLAYMRFAIDKPWCDRLYFVKEDIFFIAFLLLLINACRSSKEILIILSVIAYRSAMLISNTASIFDIQIIFSFKIILAIMIFTLLVTIFITWVK